MLYEQYRARMSKLADFLDSLRKYRILIISICLAVLSLTAVLLGISGIVYDSKACPAEITAGDGLSYRAGAIFNSVSYEFRAEDSDVWTDEQPARPGAYLVRSVSHDIAGKPRYGKVHAFTVLPRTVTVTADCSSVVYGELPPVKAELLYSDRITCSEFVYADYSAENTSAEPVASAVTAYDADGNDVSYTYNFVTAPSDIAFIKRGIKVSVTPYTVDYDGKEHPHIPYEGYEISSETPLADGDTEEVYVRVFQTSAGKYDNEIYFKIYRQTENGRVEVTSNYDFDVTSGTLVINKRTLVITTSDLTATYDGGEKSNKEFTLSESSRAALESAGHTVSVTGYTSEINADEYENILEFAVTDKDGKDVTSNYNFDCTYGKITINPRPLICNTDGASWYYDGKVHSENTGFIITINSESSYAGHDEIAYFIEGSEMHVKDVKDSCENRLKIGVKNSVTGEDVTANYAINYVYGELTVIPRPISVRVLNAEWHYDGKAHSSSEHEITFDEELFETALVDGHSVRARALKSLTDVAKGVPNAIDFGIYDGETAVTGNYGVNLINGTLTVLPREITVRAGSAEKVYDGTPLTGGNKAEAVNPSQLVEGHTITARNEGYKIEAGFDYSEIPDAESVRIADADGKDVTKNYSVVGLEKGTLTVLKREITLTAGSDEKIYDGAPLTCGLYNVSSVYESPLAEGQELTVRVSGERTNAGSGENIIASYQVTWGTTDVTVNYTVNCEKGALTVLKREAVISTDGSNEGELVYNGLEQSVARFKELTDDNPFKGILEGHFAYIKKEFSAIDADTYDNEHVFGIKAGVGEVTDENDVTDNYAITVLYGKLTIEKRPVTVITQSKTDFIYNGRPHSYGGHTVSEQTPLALESHYTVSYELAEATEVLKEGEEPVANTMKIAVYDDEGDISHNYAITVVAEGLLTVNALAVKVESGSTVLEYNGKGQSYPILQTVGETALVEGHGFKYNSVPEFINVKLDENGNTESYENLIGFTITDKDGSDKTHNYSIAYSSGTVTIVPREMLIVTDSKEWTFDGENHVSVLVKDADNKLLDGAPYYHMLAVNSGQLPMIKDAGTTVNRFAVAVLDRNFNDISYNYGIKYEYGTLEVKPLPLKVTAKSAEKIYDATPLSGVLVYGEGKDYTVEHNGKQTEYENIIGLGYTFEALTEGEAVNVDDGNVTKVIASEFKVYDGSGVLTDLKNFDITFVEGTLTVRHREIKVKAGSAEKTYNGLPLECKETENCIITSNHTPALSPAIVSGQILTVVINSSYTEAGSWYNVIESYEITADGEDVTRNYNVELLAGELKINKRGITVYTKSDKKIYDGTALTCNAVEDITTTANDGFSPLVSDHTIVLTYTGAQTSAGTSDNTVDVELTQILAGGGTPVTENYEINYEYGTLEVKHREITVQTLSKTDFIYDGQEHSYLQFTIISGSTADNQQAFADEDKEYTTVTDVDDGEKDNAFSLKITDADGNPVTENYKITYDAENCGKIKVNPRPINVFAEDCEKIYDGTADVPDEIKKYGSAHSQDETLFGTVNGHEIYADITGEIGANVGEYKISIDGKVVIKDGENDVTNNYTVTKTYPDGAKLTVKPRPIKIVTGGFADVEYDGNKHFLEEADTASDSGYALADGHYFKYTFHTDAVNVERDAEGNIVGTDNILGVEIWGEEDVTDNYEITGWEYGKLIIIPRTLIVKTQSAEKEYDGAPLTKDGAEFERLLSGHTAEITVNGSRTDAGESLNTVDGTTLKVTATDGSDVTGNYAVSEEGFGTLKVLPRTLVVVTGGDTKEYDGTPLTNGYTEFFNFVEGHEAFVKTNGSQTEAGESFNTVDETTLKVTASDGSDVTGNYILETDCGTLTVTPRGIKVSTGSAVKVYDGKPLTFDKWEITEGSLVEGHYAAVLVTGSQTEIGESKNFFEIDIHNENGDSVLKNYLVTKDEGTLKVTENTDTGDKVYVRVKTDNGGMVFLREASVGDYLGGMNWSPAEEYGGVINYEGVNYGYNYLTSLILQEAGYASDKAQIELRYGGYLIPYHAVTGVGDYTVQLSDTVNKRGEGGLIYSLEYMPYDYLASGKPNASHPFANEEAQYGAFVREKYLGISASLREFLGAIIKAEGLTADNVSAVAQYIKSVAVYDAEHNFTDLENSPDVVQTFLSGYGFGVCRHYAMSAVMLYRALGIPARYTTGFAVNTKAGEWADLSVGHAWVEIYVDGLGWVAIDVTPSSSSGGDIAPFEITLRPEDEVKTYDGTPLTAETLAFDSVLDYLCSEGYSYEVEFEGSRVEIGESESSVRTFILYAPDGTVARNVNYTYETGVLKVVAEEVITIHTYEIKKEYDGKPVYLEKDDWYADGLPEGYTLEVIGLENVGLSEAGNLSSVSFENSVVTAVYDADGNDVTDYFYIAYDPDVSITLKSITVSTPDMTKEYDGTALGDGKYEITFGGLVSGHTLKVTEFATIVDTGEAVNAIGFTIVNENGADVSMNYMVSTVFGKLTVTDGD